MTRFAEPGARFPSCQMTHHAVKARDADEGRAVWWFRNVEFLPHGPAHRGIGGTLAWAFGPVEAALRATALGAAATVAKRGAEAGGGGALRDARHAGATWAVALNDGGAARLRLSAVDVAGDAVEGALDVAKLYAAASAKFPPPPEAEEGADPPPPQPWAAEDVVAPTGSATSDALAEWAKAAFGYGSALLASHAGLSLQLLVSAAAGDEAVELDEAMAVGLHEACVMLSQTFTEEAKAAAAEAAAAEAAAAEEEAAE